MRAAPFLVVGALIAVCLTPLVSAPGAAPTAPASREVLVAGVGSSETFGADWGAGRISWGRDAERAFLRCTTTGAGDLSMVTSRGRLPAAVDLRGRFLRLWVKVDDASRLSAMELRLASGGLHTDYFSFAVPLYEDERFNVLQSGHWLALTLSFGSARVSGSPDRSAIDALAWIVRDRGRGDAGTARPLAAYWGGLWADPEPESGVVSLTFDDGYDEHLEVAAPLMKQHGFRGTAYVMPDQIGLYGYLTRDDLRVLQDGYGWDVAAHHFTPFTDFRARELEQIVDGVRGYLLLNGFAKGADHLAYPLGKHDPKIVVPVVSASFHTARLASAGPETLPPGDPHRLRSLNVMRSTTPEEIGRAAARAREHREWLILMFHYLVERPREDTAYAIDDFRRALEAIDAEGVPVRTVSEVFEVYGATAP
jgi:peptidoglycan/xylan/chitin deacetylase (PgdA/CDA1 family)